jgi:hypothetical protein
MHPTSESVALSIAGVPIRLTPERWGHIATRHPEVSSLRQQVLETIEAPDVIQAGDRGVLLAVRLFPSTPLTRKHLVVPYRETQAGDGFVLTAYLTSGPSTRRTVLWTRSESWIAQPH